MPDNMMSSSDPFMGYDPEDAGSTQPEESLRSTSSKRTTTTGSRFVSTTSASKATTPAVISMEARSGNVSQTQLYDVICCRCKKTLNLLNVHYTFQCIHCKHKRCDNCEMSPIGSFVSGGVEG